MCVFFNYKRNATDSSLPCSQEADISSPQLTALYLYDRLELIPVLFFSWVSARLLYLFTKTLYEFPLSSRLYCGLGWRGRYSDLVQAAWSGDRIPVGTLFSAAIQTIPGANPFSYAMGTGSNIPVGKAGWVVEYNTHLNIASRLKKELNNNLQLWAFVACSRTNLSFFYYFIFNDKNINFNESF